MRSAAYKEASNTFPIPEIIYDPSLVLSPHIILLGLILADGAFAAPNLTCAEQLSKLDIRPGYNQLPLLLLLEKADIPVFRKSIKMLYGWKVLPDQPLPYSTPLPYMKKLGVTYLPGSHRLRVRIASDTAQAMRSTRVVRVVYPESSPK